ncbi:MAG: hypothetical protein CM1200mP9_05380 [Gammaproteobacteria bacterium]|nr:MAG: hypothetical protein CM1200mP9_05380 [Gammaproteobacteria bacterium]
MFLATFARQRALCRGFFQGEPERGFRDTGRFIVNSTLGVGGLLDIATVMGLEPQQEDLGQVLASWGYTRSRYLFVPVLGPTTVRDLPHLIVRAGLPRLAMHENYKAGQVPLTWPALVREILLATDVRDEASLDPYTFTREAFYQRRRDAFSMANHRLRLDSIFY